MADYNFLARGIGPSLVEGSHAAYFGGKARQEADEEQGTKNAAPYLADAMKGDPTAITQLATTAPHLLAHVYPQIARLDAVKQAHLQKVADWAGDTAGAILDAPEPQRAGMYATAKTSAAAQGIPTDSWPAQYDPNWLAIQRAHAIGAKALFQSTHAKPKAAGAGAGAGPDLEPMASAAPPPGAGGTAVADAGPPPPNALAPTAVAPVVAQAEPPPGPSGPPMIADAGPPPMGGAAPPNAGGIGAGEPPEAPPVEIAQAPPPQAASPAPAPAAGQPSPQGVIWPTDPSLKGGVMMGHRAKPGQPLMPAEVAGHFIYKMPDGKTVLYKPTPAGASATNVDPALTGDDVYAALPPARAAEIRSIVNGDNPIPPPSVRTPYGQETRNLVFQAAGPDFSDTMHASRMDMRKKLNGKLGDALTTQGTIYSHLQELQDVGEELKNTPYPVINKIGNYLGMNEGDPRVTNMINVKRRVNEELEKYFSGTGGATVSGLADAQKDLNESMAPEQLEGAIRHINKLISGRQNEVINQVNRGMGYKPDSPQAFTPDKLLSKEAIAARDTVQARLKTKEAPKEAAAPEAAPATPTVRRYNPDTGKIE